jgi:DNA primase large subunit
MNKAGGNFSNILLNNIPTYNSSPSGVIQVEELEELLSLRHELLHNIEARQQFLEAEKTQISFKPLIQNYESKIGWTTNLENDKTSHFILSLAFCKTDQERLWFANLESKLFMERIKITGIEIEEVLKMFEIPLERQDSIDDHLQEKIRFREKSNHLLNTPTQIYRVPFEYALNLIASMQYFLHKGFIYISKNEIFQLVETVFKESLIKKLVFINKHLDRALSDSRIKYLIYNFQSRREVETLSKAFSTVNIENISFKEVDALAEKTFPLCMQLLNRSLNSEGHTKHWGRLQYGLFLKGIGLSLEESLNFWKNKFSKSISTDKFEKEYSYNIRHSYGKEGKRNDYIPYSCNKIQNLQPPTSIEHHGCPFKIYSDDKLRQLLYEMKFKELDVLKILEKVKGREPSVIYIFNL